MYGYCKQKLCNYIGKTVYKQLFVYVSLKTLYTDVALHLHEHVGIIIILATCLD